MTALVLCGSIGSTTEMWEPQLPALGGFDVIAVDHPGHGREPVPAGPIDLGRLGRRVLAVLERWFTPGFPDRARWRAMMTSVDREGYARCCEALRDADLREEIRRIEAPTLVIAGAEDPSISAEEVELLVSRIPRARLVAIEGAAHIANVEQPEAFTAALLSHLEAQ